MVSARRWPRKREFLAYYLLYSTFDRKEVNVGDAIDILMNKLCVTRKTAINIIDHLVRAGFIERTRVMHIRCRDLKEILDSLLNSYIALRSRRCSKARC